MLGYLRRRMTRKRNLDRLVLWLRKVLAGLRSKTRKMNRCGMRWISWHSASNCWDLHANDSLSRDLSQGEQLQQNVEMLVTHQCCVASNLLRKIRGARSVASALLEVLFNLNGSYVPGWSDPARCMNDKVTGQVFQPHFPISDF